jgi:hypothetical protein
MRDGIEHGVRGHTTGEGRLRDGANRSDRESAQERWTPPEAIALPSQTPTRSSRSIPLGGTRRKL